MTTFERIAELPLTIDGYTLEGRERRISAEFERVTTTFHLQGDGEEGLGEDVTYSPEDQRAQQARGPTCRWPARGRSRRSASTSASSSCSRRASRACRRSATTAAGRSRAPRSTSRLRQTGQSLAQALGREESPIHFVASLRIGSPPDFDVVGRRLEEYPWLQFKLDGTPDWDQALIDRLAATGAVASIDFKGAYKGTPVDVDTDPAFYRRIAETLPNAWLEDPDLTDPEADAVLEPYRHRITWDAPIHSIADIENLAFAPRTINVKPSRFGSTKELFAAYDYCAERGIEIYGGGQSELGVGRGQIQYLASVFHPDGVNDIAPAGYDWAEFPTGLPASPLAPDHEPTGFRRRT